MRKYAAKMEKAINKIDGVKEATVNFITTKLIIGAMMIRCSPSLQKQKKLLKKSNPTQY